MATNQIRGSVSIERLLYLGSLTTTVRDTITPNGPGAIIWNETTGQAEIWDGTTWGPIGTTAPVDSVNGQTGVVVLTDADIAVTPAGNQTGVTVEEAINNLQTAIDNVNNAAANGFNALGADPVDADGDNGEYAINVLTGEIFGPKDETAPAGSQWPTTGENAYTNQLATTAPPAVGTGAVGTSNLAARADHTHDAPSVAELTGPFGTAAAAAEAGTTANVALVSDGAGGWTEKEISCKPHCDSFTTGDWTPGTPNTLTIPLATHGLPYAAGDVYDVTVTDVAGNILTVCRQTVTGGDVVITTDGAVFAGSYCISQG